MHDVTQITALAPVPVGAQRLGIPVKKAYDLISAQVIPAGVVVRVGRQLRFDMARLERWIEAGGSGYDGGWRREAH